MPETTFTLNGKPTTVSYESGMDFLEVLRAECGVVSAKNGCAPEGACGCCAVLVDGQPVLACLRKPEHMAGHDVVTLEGVPEDMRRVLGEAFLLEGAVQCGFCIPGHRDSRRGAARTQPHARSRKRSPSRWTLTCAAAPATHASSTPFRPQARPGTITSSSRALSRGGILTSAKSIGLTRTTQERA